MFTFPFFHRKDMSHRPSTSISLAAPITAPAVPPPIPAAAAAFGVVVAVIPNKFMAHGA